MKNVAPSRDDSTDFAKGSVCFFVLISLLSACILLAAGSCGRKTMTPAEASQWIEAYSPYRLDPASKIKVELTNLTQQKLDSGQNLKGVFSFSPRIKGEARLSPDLRFMEFVPEGVMKSGTEYKCNINLSRLTGVDSLADFQFDFYVVNSKLKFLEVHAVPDMSNMSDIVVTGVLASNAGLDFSADLAKDIICSDPDAEVTVVNAKGEKGVEFKVTGIQRREKDRKIEIALKPFSAYSMLPAEVTVPALHDFRLMDSRRVDVANPYIELTFSRPLSTRQEPDGLVTIDGVDDVRLQRDGAILKVFYPGNSLESLVVNVSGLLKNTEGESLDEELRLVFEQEPLKPQIEIPFHGSILPDGNNLRLPFRAVNLAAVDVEVVKIFPSNVMNFIHDNDLNDNSRLRRYGRLIYHRTVRLDMDKSRDLRQWQNFSIDLKDLFRREPGAVYNVRLTFRKAYSLYGRVEADVFEQLDGLTPEDEKTWSEERDYIYRRAPEYNWMKYDWYESDNPMSDSYYMEEYNRMPEVNLVASELGLIVKRANDKEMKVAVTNLLSALPEQGASVTAYDFQHQKVGSATTDPNGFAQIKTARRPYMVVASKGSSKTYLKVNDYRSLDAAAGCDVSGVDAVDGLKGFIYGERGVWRPGDDIHLTFILEDSERRLPANHPVVLELFTPSDQLYERITMTKGVDGFYAFNIPTASDVPTGLWRAKIKAGNKTFEHPVRIETIKPNRLKINIISPAVIHPYENDSLGLTARWLSGATASNLQASLEMKLYPNSRPFPNFSDFSFSNPLASNELTEREVLNGRLDSLGGLVKENIVGADHNSPGMLLANLTAKVTEPGGDVSVAVKSVPFSPFDVYVGLNLSKNEFVTDSDITLPVVVVNSDGKLLKRRELAYKIYRLSRESWFESDGYDVSRYVRNDFGELIDEGDMTVENGRGEISFKVDYPDYGRYLVIARDKRGGHAAGGEVRVDWPGWRGVSAKDDAADATDLSFALDKKEYRVGEDAVVYLPRCEGGRVLLSIENGGSVLRRMWVNLSGVADTKYAFKVDKSMAPNFYVTATLLRPHKLTDFSKPIRLYGVRGAKVFDAASVLHPVIDMADELKPQQAYSVKVSERDNKPMTYTLAIVDEGLLDITNFRTPRPWEAMNRKVALGVNTWDMYDDVIGSFGAEFPSVLSVGGDEGLRKAAGGEKRFRPVVTFAGPFTLKSGSNVHKFSMPNYVGSVRVMVVAAHDGAYGNADKTVKVSSPISVLSSMPRQLACGDEADVAVNVFSSLSGKQKVNVRVEADGPVSVSGARSREVSVNSPGEALTLFSVKADGAREGKGRIIVKASVEGCQFADTTFIDVVNPMPVVVDSQEASLAPRSSAELRWTPSPGEITSLEIAAMPAVNFGEMALFMEHYPHLCTEQLSSKAIFFLYGRDFLDDARGRECELELPALMKAIRSRQTSEGGFVYWPDDSYENSRATALAGIALAEASRQGFGAADVALSRWVDFQKKAAGSYKFTRQSDFEQALRLFSLAVAGQPLYPSMNRLREAKRLSRNAAMMLAAAYAEAGRVDVARKLLERAMELPEEDSSLFSLSIELEAEAASGDLSDALSLARKIAKDCDYASCVTEDVALSAMALKRLSDLSGDAEINVRVVRKGSNPLVVKSRRALAQVALDGEGCVTVENLGDNSLQLCLLNSRKPSVDEKVAAASSGLAMDIKYESLKGWPLLVSDLSADREFKAVITVRNSGEDIDYAALTYAIPAGWEIWNNRLYVGDDDKETYTDIRDASANFYFSLKGGETATFTVRLRAAYKGDYLLPSAVCEDMYNPAHRAVSASSRIVVK